VTLDSQFNAALFAGLLFLKILFHALLGFVSSVAGTNYNRVAQFLKRIPFIQERAYYLVCISKVLSLWGVGSTA